jgi:hypothetical protein
MAAPMNLARVPRTTMALGLVAMLGIAACHTSTNGHLDHADSGASADQRRIEDVSPQFGERT